MARNLTPQDCYALMNSLVEQATGQASLTATDTSSFVSAGELVLATGSENVLNSLSLILGRTLIAVRPYEAKLRILNALNSGLYANRLRKISYYSREAEPAGFENTQLYTNLAMGFDNGVNPDSQTPPQDQSTGSMFVQNQPVPLEINFAGSSVWDTTTTVYEVQLKVAFRSEAEFAEFVSGILTEKGNDIESTKEAFNRMTLLNFIAGAVDLNASTGSAIDLVPLFGTYIGQTVTRADLLPGGTYATEFREWFTAFFKGVCDKMENRSLKWHWSPTKVINGQNYYLLRHTPKSRQRAIMYGPYFRDAQATIMPALFNANYLDMGKQFETVEYWQAENSGAAINVTPAIPDTSGQTQIQGTAVNLDYVLGVIYDEDAMMIDYQFEGAYSSPLETKKLFRNITWHFKKNAINDFTENHVVMYLG